MTNQSVHPVDPQYHRAILALLAHPTRQAAAAAAGISVDTLARWQREPAFVDAYQVACREAVAQATRTFAAACAAAADTLVNIMTDPHAHAYTRLRAATGILTFAYQGQAQADLHARCAALETALAALQDAAPAPPPALACNLDFAVLTPEDERLARLEAEMAAQQRRAEEQQRKDEELRQQREASAAHWQAYTQALPPLPSRVVQEVREAWPTFPDLRVTETHCAYTPPASWREMTSGQRLLAWLCDRYADYRAGLPVALTQQMTDVIVSNIGSNEKTLGGYRCPHCRLYLPNRTVYCPHCKVVLSHRQVKTAGGKYVNEW